MEFFWTFQNVPLDTKVSIQYLFLQQLATDKWHCYSLLLYKHMFYLKNSKRISHCVCVIKFNNIECVTDQSLQQIADLKS